MDFRPIMGDDLCKSNGKFHFVHTLPNLALNTADNWWMYGLSHNGCEPLQRNIKANYR